MKSKSLDFHEELEAVGRVFGRPNGAMVSKRRSNLRPKMDIHRMPIFNSWNHKKMSMGLRNVGNTCFLASTIQCLQHIPAWNNYLLCQHSKMCRESPANCTVCKLKRLTYLCFKTNCAVPPIELSMNINKIGSHMVVGRQEDAHEFLTCLFDKIQKNLTAQLGSLDPASEMTTALAKIFGGYLRSQIICLECQQVTNTYEEFFNISLDITGVSTIEEALKKFVTPESMGGTEWYSCERCRKLCRAQKKYVIDSLPHALIIHLKRYSYIGSIPFKIRNFIDFGERIDLNTYLDSELRGNLNTYKLSGITVHEGFSLNSGHYYSYVSSPKSFKRDRQWFCLNDSCVLKSSWDVVARQEAYMLYYVRAPPLSI